MNYHINYSPIENVGVYVPGGTASYPKHSFNELYSSNSCRSKKYLFTTPALNSKS